MIRIAGVLLVLSGCVDPAGTLAKDGRRSLVSGGAPDPAPFLAAGCIEVEGQLQGEPGKALDCSKAAFAATLSCARRIVPTGLGADLVPPRNVAVCLHREKSSLKGGAEGSAPAPDGSREPTPTAYFERVERFEETTWLRYLVARDGNIELVSTVAELGRVTAPIETPEEAAAYADLARKGEVLLGVAAGDVEWIASSPRAGYAAEREGRFELRVFRGPGLGCRQPMTAHELRVDKDGAIQDVGESEPIFRTKVCAD